MRTAVLLTAFLIAAPAPADDRNFKKLPDGRVVGRPDIRTIDPDAIPVAVRLAALEKTVAALAKENAALKQRDGYIDASINSNYKTLAGLITVEAQRNTQQDEKLATVGQAVGAVAPHTHGVQVQGPGIACHDGQCSLVGGGPMLFGSTVGQPK